MSGVAGAAWKALEDQAASDLGTLLLARSPRLKQQHLNSGPVLPGGGRGDGAGPRLQARHRSAEPSPLRGPVRAWASVRLSPQSCVTAPSFLLPGHRSRKESGNPGSPARDTVDFLVLGPLPGPRPCRGGSAGPAAEIKGRTWSTIDHSFFNS